MLAVSWDVVNCCWLSAGMWCIVGWSCFLRARDHLILRHSLSLNPSFCLIWLSIPRTYARSPIVTVKPSEYALLAMTLLSSFELLTDTASENVKARWRNGLCSLLSIDDVQVSHPLENSSVLAIINKYNN